MCLVWTPTSSKCEVEEPLLKTPAVLCYFSDVSFGRDAQFSLGKASSPLIQRRRHGPDMRISGIYLTDADSSCIVWDLMMKYSSVSGTRELMSLNWSANVWKLYALRFCKVLNRSAFYWFWQHRPYCLPLLYLSLHYLWIMNHATFLH